MSLEIASLWIGTHPDFEGEVYMITAITDGIACFLTCLQTGEEIMIWADQLTGLFEPLTGSEDTSTCK